MRPNARWLVSAFAALALSSTVMAVAAAPPSGPAVAPLAPVEAALQAAEAKIAAMRPGVTDDATARLLSQQESSIATARSLLATADAGRDPLDTAVDAAKTATAAAAETLGVVVTSIANNGRHTSPSAAAFALLARHGLSPTPVQRASIIALDRLAAPARASLTALIDTFVEFEAATAVAYANVDAGVIASLTQATAPDALALAGIDLGPVLSARNALLDAITGFREASDAAAGTRKAPVAACPALALGLDGADDTYTADCALVIDVAGDDTYVNNAGGGGGCDPVGIRAAALVDLGGNDGYVSGRSCGVNGGGRIGAGLLVDLNGSDTYSGGSNGVNGGGSLGIGLLIDASGDDSYSAAHTGGNGGAEAGSGLLIDVSGADSYQGGSNGGNGGASAGGRGALIDFAGDDNYFAGSNGANGGGGLGGSGLLVDATGTDYYFAYLYGGNGWGALGAGLLVDAGGAGDVYNDDAGGSGTDQTVVPKGVVGAQIDVDSPVAPPSPPTVSLPPVPSVSPSVPPLPSIGETFVSDDCDTGTDVVSGFVDGAYLKLRHRPSATDPNATLVCVAAEAGGAHLGGRLDLGGASGTPAGIDQDSASVAACGTNVSNIRVQSGTVAGGQPYWIDVTPLPAGSIDAAWVCVRFTSTVGFRLRFAGGVGQAGFTADPPTAHVPPYAEPSWPGNVPSAACANAATATKLVDVTAAGTHVGLYGWQESASRTHLCVRGGGAGGVLTVDTAASPGVSPVLTTRNDLSPCSFDLFTRSDPPSLGVYLSDPADLPDLPVSACVEVAGTARAATIGADGPATVTWTPDPS